MIKQYDHLIKLILIGGSGVGKSSLLTRFAHQKFSEVYLTTIGVDFKFRTIQHEKRRIKFQIWDTAGQERFRTITSTYYKGADGIIMVYDLTDPTSIDDLEKYWIPEAYNHCDKNIPVLFLGNKCDTERLVKPQKVKKIADNYGFRIQEVSAKTGVRVQDSIKNFGIEIARVKFQKMRITQLGFSQTKSSSNLSESKHLTLNSQKMFTISERYLKEPHLQASKLIQSQQTVQSRVVIKLNEPGYKKKCC